MPVDRIDHRHVLFRSPAQGEDAPKPAKPPLVLPELVEHLRAEFVSQADEFLPTSPRAVVNSADTAVAVAHAVTYAGGQLSVIQYLEKLMEAQQG